MKQKIKIILADDEVLFRKGISFLLDREENIDVIFEASDGVELIDFLKDKQKLSGAGMIITELGDKFMLIKWERFKD